jgi:hypothetical protein
MRLVALLGTLLLVACGGKETDTTRASRPPAKVDDRIEVVVRAPWGAGNGSLGHTTPQEGNPEGPMSLAVDRDGRIFVLDQVNHRIASFGGGLAPASVPIPGDTFQDLALDGRGGFVLLDRLQTRSLAFVGADGRIDHEVSLLGSGIEEAGGVTGLFRLDDGYWVEVEHQRAVRIADALGQADTVRPMIGGRPSRDGASILRAALGQGGEVVDLFAGPVGAGAATQRIARLHFPIRVSSLSELDSGPDGRTLVAANLVEMSTDTPAAVIREVQTIATVDPSGALLDRVDLPPLIAPEEQFRPVRLGGDGAIHQLRCEPDGVVIRRIVR